MFRDQGRLPDICLANQKEYLCPLKMQTSGKRSYGECVSVYSPLFAWLRIYKQKCYYGGGSIKSLLKALFMENSLHKPYHHLLIRNSVTARAYSIKPVFVQRTYYMDEDLVNYGKEPHLGGN